MLKYWFCL